MNVVEEDDLEAGSPQLAEEETNNVAVLKFIKDNFNRAVQSPIGEKALAIMPTFPATFYVTIPGLLSLAQIKGQLVASGFPSPTLHKWYIVCVTSLLTAFVISIAQWFISTATTGAASGGNPTSVYNIFACLARFASYFIFLVSLAVLLYS